MWRTDTTDIYHNIFGLEIAHPPKPDDKHAHDPYVLYKSPDFDIIHYKSIDTIKLIENDSMGSERILKDMFPNEKITTFTILRKEPPEIEEFLSRYFNTKIRLDGVERAYDRFMGIPYHIFYYVELL